MELKGSHVQQQDKAHQKGTTRNQHADASILQDVGKDRLNMEG